MIPGDEYETATPPAPAPSVDSAPVEESPQIPAADANSILPPDPEPVEAPPADAVPTENLG